MTIIKFKYQNMPGTIQLHKTTAFVFWGGASFHYTAAIGKLKTTIQKAISDALVDAYIEQYEHAYN